MCVCLKDPTITSQITPAHRQVLLVRLPAPVRLVCPVQLGACSITIFSLCLQARLVSAPMVAGTIPA